MSQRPVALVTGGAAGIGAELCRSFLADGFEVLCLDRNAPQPAEGLHFVSVDLMDATALQDVAAEIAARFAVRHVVHNAGVIRPSPIAGMAHQDMAALAGLHLTAPLILVQALLPGMKQARFGRVVLISSRAALGLAGRSAYSATKAGIIGLGRAWALELAPFGITVNMVAPGPIGDTPMFEALVPKGSETEARITAGIPVGRLGRPSDVANAVRFFAGDAADFITGQVLYVCGGASVGTAPL